MYRKYRAQLFFLSVCTMMLLSSAVVSAGQGFYATSTNLRPGMLVSLTKNPTVVEPSSDKSTTALVGVVGESTNDGPIEPNQIAVQSEGVVSVLVSTIDGDIKVGDQISPSSIVGFGARFSGGSGWVVGSAQRDLSSTSEGAVKTVVNDSAGKQHEVYVASIPVQLKVAYHANPAPPSPTTSAVPEEIQSVADSVAGKHASTVAIVLSFFLILSGVSVAGLIVVTAAREGIKAIARQPLVKQAIMGRMLQSFGVALAIIISVNVGALVLLRIL